MTDSDHTKLASEVKRSLDGLLKKVPRVRDIARSIESSGGRAILVGGVVRDLLRMHYVTNVQNVRAIDFKDLDVELHGLSPGQLEDILRQHGTVDQVGKAFGVFRVRGLDADWSLPRSDSVGRKPQVTIDSAMSFEQACLRRDLTVNAMGIDILTYELLDPCGGGADLKAGVLRSPDIDRFADDPLRFYRVMQFIGRLAMEPDDELSNLCARMAIDEVSRERIGDEFGKLFLKSVSPSRGIRWVARIGRLPEVFLELAATIGVQQDPGWHPEGDVFEHTMQTLDAAAAIAHESYENDHDRLTLIYAAVCHDLGKVTTTKVVDGRLRSLGHEQASAQLVNQVLARMTCSKEFGKPVQLLVRHHMASIQFANDDVGVVAYRRLADKLAPRTNLKMLVDVMCADKRGRNPDGPGPLSECPKEVMIFSARAQEAGVLHSRVEPLLHGRDLLEIAPEGERLGELLRYAYRLQIEEGITDKDVLKRRIYAHEGREVV